MHSCDTMMWEGRSGLVLGLRYPIIQLIRNFWWKKSSQKFGQKTESSVAEVGETFAGNRSHEDEKNQIMTTNVWLLQRWYDYQLKWDPAKYGNVRVLYVPANEIWLPDIVLYNNADGNYVITIMNKAKVTFDGKVEWEPPAIYKSYCSINVEFFPFDEQECDMKFGSWTHHGNAVTLKHMMQANKDELHRDARVKDIQWGMDLDGFEQSSEWDVLAVPAQRKEKFYTCCSDPFPDVTFNITVRRKPLFYTVNLIIPCTAISSLTIFVFYLPSGSKEKVGLGIYTLVSLTVFFLVLVDINPPTSFVVPLMGKYLLFTMILIVFSIFVTVVVVSDHFRSPSWCKMPGWVREVFINILPKLLLMERPLKYTQKTPRSATPTPSKRTPSTRTPSTRMRGIYDPVLEAQQQGSDILYRDEVNFTYGNTRDSEASYAESSSGNPSHYLDPDCEEFEHPHVKEMLDEVSGLAEHTREDNTNMELEEDWAYVAMVLDRALFWLFSGSWIVGTFGILLQAPMIYDVRSPLVANDDAVNWCGEVTCVHNDRPDYSGDLFGAGSYADHPMT